MHFNFTFLTTLKQGSHATDLCVDTREESPFYSRRFELQKKKKKKMNAPIMQCSNNFTRFCYLSFTKLSFQSKTTFCLHLYFRIKTLCYCLGPKTKFVIDYKKSCKFNKVNCEVILKIGKNCVKSADVKDEITVTFTGWIDVDAGGWLVRFMFHSKVYYDVTAWWVARGRRWTDWWFGGSPHVPRLYNGFHVEKNSKRSSLRLRNGRTPY